MKVPPLTSPELLAILQELEPEAGWRLCTDPAKQAACVTDVDRCNAFQPARMTHNFKPPLEVAFFPLMRQGVPVKWRTSSATGLNLRKAVAMALAGYRAQGWRPAPPPAHEVVWRKPGEGDPRRLLPVLTRARGELIEYWNTDNSAWSSWTDNEWAPCPAPQGLA